MACIAPARPAPPDRGAGTDSIYRSVWRWHFYAGLAVLPFMLWLAVTGGLYLYKPEIEAMVYARWSHVAPSGAPLPIDEIATAVERQSHARVVQVMRPADPAASWRMTLKQTDGRRRLAFVDPYRGVVLGETCDGGIMQTVRDLHSLIITGPIGNAVIEMVAGWAVILLLSGLYLWWPRRGGPVLGLRGRPGGRLFWRDLHASVGLIAAAVILFLAITGMPWTGVAGEHLQAWVAAHGFGRPVSPGSDRWKVAKNHDHDVRQSLPWSMQAAPQPEGHSGGNIGPARAAAVATVKGLKPPWTMTLPGTPEAPYVISQIIARADDARVLYIDASDGRLLQDARYAGFGAGARAIELGIAVHQGQQYGAPNRLLMLGGCLSIVLLVLTAPVLWWKRRRNGRLEAPPRATDPRNVRSVAMIMVLAGLLFPLTGLSMLVALCGEWLWAYRRKAVR